MKKLSVLIAAAVLALSAFVLPQGGAAAAATYTLRDDFGAAPLARTISENMERVELSDVHKPYTKYGFGVKLKTESTGREYITYDVAGVTEAEISAVVMQSNFGANHGWGLSLGVTDNVNDMPLNNTQNINLQSLFPIYLSEDGKPFILYNNAWWCYIAGEKFSFVPSTLDVKNQLRPFTVPDEVQGKIDEDGFTVLEKGYLYPMLNLEYFDGEKGGWIPMVHDSANYRIENAEFIGGEKEYSVTVKVKNIPENAEKIRIGSDYIRKTLKPSSEGDTEADVYETFPVPYDEAIYVTGVKLTLDRRYDGGFEELEQTGIAVGKDNARVRFGFGEDFSSDGLTFYDVLGDGVREQAFDGFTVDSAAYDKWTPGIYKINVKKGGFTASYYVETMLPDELAIDTEAVEKTVSKKNPLNLEGLKVTARTNVGTVNEPQWIEKEVPADKYGVDASGVDYKKAGEYTVKISVGTGTDVTTGEFTVTVEKADLTALWIVLGAVAAVGVAAAVAVVVRKKKKTDKNA